MRGVFLGRGVGSVGIKEQTVHLPGNINKTSQLEL